MLVPKTYDLLCDAVEVGVRYGLGRRCTEKLELLRLSDDKLEMVVQETSDAVINSILEHFVITPPGLSEGAQ